jgi:hypothetical protein
VTSHLSGSYGGTLWPVRSLTEIRQQQRQPEDPVQKQSAKKAV